MIKGKSGLKTTPRRKAIEWVSTMLETLNLDDHLPTFYADMTEKESAKVRAQAKKFLDRFKKQLEGGSKS